MYLYACFYIQVIASVSPDRTAFDSAAVLLDLPSCLEVNFFFVSAKISPRDYRLMLINTETFYFALPVGRRSWAICIGFNWSKHCGETFGNKNWLQRPNHSDNKGNEYVKMTYGEDNFEPAHRLLMDGRNYPVSFKCITFNLIVIIYITAFSPVHFSLCCWKLSFKFKFK